MARIKIEYPENTLYRYETTIRLTDLSQAMHLGFDRMVNILHDAAAGFFKSLGHDMTQDQKIRLIFADLAVQYQSEAFREDRLKIDVGVGEISSKGFEAIFKINNMNRSEEVVALAKIGVVFFDYTKRCTAEIPSDIRRQIS